MFDSIDARITKASLRGVIKGDPLLQKSLGLQNRFSILKASSVLLAGWAFILLVTPLPEQLFLSRLGLLGLILVVLSSWGADIGFHASAIDEAAERLAVILKKDPKIALTTTEEAVQIKHALFDAKCEQMTKLKLAAMLRVETDVQEAVRELTQGIEAKAAKKISQVKVENNLKPRRDRSASL